MNGQLLWELPYASAVAKDYWTNDKKLCFHCLSPPGKFCLEACQKCGLAFYCSNKCFLDDAKETNLHTFECAAFQRASRHQGALHELQSDASLRLVARVISRSAKDKGKNTLSEVSPFNPYCKLRILQDLMSHEDKLSIEGLWSSKWEKFRKHFRNIKPSPFEFVDEKLFLRIYGQIRTNSFSISGFYSIYQPPSEIALGLYLQASRFDHCCSPDLKVYFEGSKICIAPFDNSLELENLSFNDLTISYKCWNGTIASTYERRDALNEMFQFLCHCPKCQDVVNDQRLWMALAQECPMCHEPLVPHGPSTMSDLSIYTYCNPHCFLQPPIDTKAHLKCLTCDIIVSHAENVSLSNVMEHFRNVIFVSLGSKSFDSVGDPLQQEKRLEKASKVFHPLKNAWLAQAYETFLDEILECENANTLYNSAKHRNCLKKSVKYGKLLANCYEFFQVKSSVYPILCAKIGKWLLELEETVDATIWYTHAKDLWSANCNHSHQCVREIENILEFIQQANVQICNSSAHQVSIICD